MEITNLELFSIRNNVSIGSGYFFLANPLGSGPNPMTFQNNVILDPVTQAISLGNAGPAMLLDNVVRSRSGQPAVSLREGYTANPVNGNAVSIGNTFTTAVPYSVSGRLLAIDDTVAAASSVDLPIPVMVPVPVNPGRPVFEIPAGAGSAAIQAAIDAAALRSGARPIVHLAPGTYPIDRTLTIPKSSDLQLIGDGGYSALLWTGAGAGPVLAVDGASRAALRDFRVHGNARAKGILVNVDDQPGGTIFMDQAALSLTSENNLLVEGLDHTNVTLSQFYHDSSQLSVKVVGGPLLATGQNAEAGVTILGGGDGGNQFTYDVENGARLLAEDVWYEGGAPGFATLAGSGSFTLSGATVYNEDLGHGGLGREIPPIVAGGFNGPVTVLNTKIGRGGISGAGNNLRVLGMGIDGPAGTPDFFQVSAPTAGAALLDSSLTVPAAGSAAVPDRANNIPSIPDFVRAMLAQVRGAQPYVRAAQAGGTDLRLLRVVVEQGTVGIHLKAAVRLSVCIDSPANRQSVSGTISAIATAPVGSTVQFSVDGVKSGPALASAPFSLALDTTKWINGAHVLTAEAADPNGNTALSPAVAITVANAAPPPLAPSGTPLVSGFAGGRIRNNYSGWVGMQFTAGPGGLNVTSLGRISLAGNTGTHVVKLVLASTGADVPGASIAVSPVAAAPGQFAYVRLPSPIVLTAGTSYYLVTLESNGGDSWYDYQPVRGTTAASIDSPVYWNGFQWIPLGIPSSSYGPVSLLYAAPAETAPAPGATPMVSSFNPSPSRNNYSGFVGMQFTVGANALTAGSLGRICLAGNSGAHTLKLVKASDGSTVPGASVSVPLSGCTPGQFVYGQLAAPVTLAPNTSYYLVSQETASQDRWYDYTLVKYTNAVSVNGPVYWDGFRWFPVGFADMSYVPLNLLFTR